MVKSSLRQTSTCVDILNITVTNVEKKVVQNNNDHNSQDTERKK